MKLLAEVLHMGKHTPKAEQQCLVERWHETDTLMATFAQANGVHPVTFGSWVERYDLEHAQTQTKPFLPVTVAPQELTAGPSPSAWPATC